MRRPPLAAGRHKSSDLVLAGRAPLPGFWRLRPWCWCLSWPVPRPGYGRRVGDPLLLGDGVAHEALLLLVVVVVVFVQRLWRSGGSAVDDDLVMTDLAVLVNEAAPYRAAATRVGSRGGGGALDPELDLGKAP